MLRRLSMRFDDAQEEVFIKRYVTDREKHFRLNAAIGLFLSTACCAWDFVLLTDVPGWVVAVRAAFFTAFALATVFNRRLGPQGREVTWTVLTILASCLVTFLTQVSHAPYRFVYCFIEIQMVMFTVTVMNLRLRYAATAIGVTFAINFCNVWLGSLTDIHQQIAVECFFVLGAALSLLHAYHSESRDRRAFTAEEQRRVIAEKLERATRIDALTGLYNRRHLDAVVKETWLASDNVSMILLDVDKFKLFNDSYGHSEGDICLTRVAGAIAEATAPEGMAFRFGGEEFLVFLPGVDLANALMIAESVRRAIEAEAIAHPALGQGRVVTASIGVANGETRGMLPLALTKMADAALYEAKEAGRNQVKARGARNADGAQSRADDLLMASARVTLAQA